MWAQSCGTWSWSAFMAIKPSCWWTVKTKWRVSGCCMHTAALRTSTAPSTTAFAMSSCRGWPWSPRTSAASLFSGKKKKKKTYVNTVLFVEFLKFKSTLFSSLQAHCQTVGQVSRHSCTQRLGASVWPVAEDGQVFCSGPQVLQGPWAKCQVRPSLKPSRTFCVANG